MSVPSDAELVLRALHERFHPHTGQKLVLRKLFHDGMKRIFVQCGRKWGKDLSLDTPIPTPDGWREMGDIRVGDYVFGDDGKPTRVIGESEVFNRPNLYRVWFSDGSYVDASSTHLWLTKTKACRKSESRARNYQKPQVVTTDEIRQTLRVGDEWNHSVDCASAVELSERDLPIPPYLLGAWLGDGDSSAGKLHCPDEEVRRHFRAYGYKLTEYDRVTCGIAGFVAELRQSNLLGNKHIPKEYLWAAIWQRKALLAGLMDTDGSCEKTGRCEFTNTNLGIVDGVCHLLSSLGQQFKRSKRVGRYRGKACKLSYKVTFYPTFNPFLLPRKAERWRGRKKPNHRFIVGVDEVLGTPSKCISVANASKLYLAGTNFIPTHNTQCLIYILYRVMLLTPKSNLIYVAPTIKQAKEIVWESSGGRIQSFLPPWAMEMFEIEIRKSDLRIVCNKNKGQILVAGSDQSRADAGGFFEGLEPEGVAIDETRLIHKDFVDTLVPNLAVKDGFIAFAGTPPDHENQYQVWKQEVIDDPRGFYVKMPSLMNDKLPYLESFLKNERRKLEARGELDEYLRQYEAEYVPSTEAFLLPSWAENIKTFTTEEFERLSA